MGPAAGGRSEGGGTSQTLRGFRLQLRVVEALLLREMKTRFGHNQLGFVWLFLEPLLLATAIALFKWATNVGRTYPGISMFVFALISYLPYFAFRAIVARAPGTLRQNMPLLFHSRIKLLDVVMARHALEMAAVITVMALIAIGVSIWGGAMPANIPTLFLGLVLLFAFSNGLGLIAAAVSAVSPVAERLIHPMVYLSLPLSGALVALHSLDPALRTVLLWNPQAHIHEMIRDGFFGDLLPSYFSVPYILLWAGLFNLIGLAALRAVRPSLEF